MKLYDELIGSILRMSKEGCFDSLPYEGQVWEMISDHSMILRSDMAYELGGQGKYGIGMTLLTTDCTLIDHDGVFLCGEDLQDISSDCNYARIALLRVIPDSLGSGNTLYRAIRKFEYLKYHFYPKGFMMRVSSLQARESVRISKKGLQDGLNFAKTGNLMIQEYKKQSEIENVQIYYVTKKDFGYEQLMNYARQGEAITKTIDHIFHNTVMDCNSCNLQEVCNEVEGLRELHFHAEGK